MKNALFLVLALLLCSYGCSNKSEVFTTNQQLITEFDKYLAYADTSGIFTPDDSYIYLKVNNRGKDTIDVLLSIDAGAYGIVNPLDTIVAFFEYKEHRVMLVGNYPNNLTCIKQDFDENTKKKVLNKYFKEEYESYLKEPFSLKPKMGDPMTMSLIFKKDGIIISAEKEYH